MQKFFLTKFIFVVIFFAVGFVIGAYLFSDSQKRSFLAITSCDECFKPNDLAGLLVSAGIQKLPKFLPSVVAETDKTLVMKHPFPQAPLHYLIFPKKDIKDFASVADSDWPYMQDMVAVTGDIIRKEKIKNYKIITNGPGIQQVTYFHLHLLGY